MSNRQVFRTPNGNYFFFADEIAGWYDHTDKKGKRTLMLRTTGGGLWNVHPDQWQEFDAWIAEQTGDPAALALDKAYLDYDTDSWESSWH